LLAETHVLVSALPYPLHLRDRMPELLWAHFTYAGVSDYAHADLWGTDVTITSARGIVQAVPLAEMVIAAAMSFAKDLGLAQRQTATGLLDGSQFSLKLVAGKTMAVIGLGGIGAEVARLSRALGMRVTATRRSATSRQADVDGVDVLYPAGELHAMLAEADFVAVTTALTAETERLLDGEAFAAMKPGAFVLNMARGEVIDEAAMKDALRSGRLGGAYMDVYSEERQRPPDPELMTFPNVVITPHNAGETDVDLWPMTEQFVDNLRLFLDGKPLRATVDWSRGY
jgi:phosphoglycerate dehydrogenase-like enzyme